MKERNYAQALEGYGGEVLLVGINYEKDRYKLTALSIDFPQAGSSEHIVSIIFGPFPRNCVSCDLHPLYQKPPRKQYLPPKRYASLPKWQIWESPLTLLPVIPQYGSL